MDARKHRWFVWCVTGMLLVALTGCGYILYPERRTEPLSHTLDPKVVIFDCLWLLVGVVPGVIALVWDGIHDTWYYTEAELEARADRPRMDVPRGTDLAVRFRGEGPADAHLVLTLQDTHGAEVASVTAVTDSDGGPDMLTLAMPADWRESEGMLTLAVNGDAQAAWNLHIVD